MSTDTLFAPVDRVVANLIAGFDAEAIKSLMESTDAIERSAGVSRGHAECLALLSLLQMRPFLLAGLCVLSAELDGTTQWILTGDAAFARQHLFAAGAIELEEVDAADIVRSQYGDLAMLATFV